jgi:hypothetical protein
MQGDLSKKLLPSVVEVLSLLHHIPRRSPPDEATSQERVRVSRFMTAVERKLIDERSVVQRDADMLSSVVHYAAHLLLARATRALPRRSVFVRGLEHELSHRLRTIRAPSLIRDASRPLLTLLLWVSMLSPEIEDDEGANDGPSRVYAVWMMDRLGITTLEGLMRVLNQIAWVDGFREGQLRRMLSNEAGRPWEE